MQDTFHVHVHRLLPLNRSDLQQRSSHRDAGVRDHHVQAAEMPHVLATAASTLSASVTSTNSPESSPGTAQASDHGVHLVFGGRQVGH